MLYVPGQPEACLEGACVHVVVIGVACLSDEVAGSPTDAERAAQVKLPHRRQLQQFGVALVALGVEIERVGVLQVLSLISLPSEDALVVGVQDEAADASEVHLRLGLHRESRPHVVVAVDHVVIVALGSSQQYSAEVDALFQAVERTHLWETHQHAGTQCGGLRYAVGG